ncbi:MAG: hypothetical protein SGI90_03450 [Candidatus Eisenbacteria bacterium]|nr:hypothetical protein [Candidatus Eisenbacteria bacterium]
MSERAHSRWALFVPVAVVLLVFGWTGAVRSVNAAEPDLAAEPGLTAEPDTTPPADRLPTYPLPNAPTTIAATPLTVLYQGRLTDGSGTPIPGPVTLQISLFGVASGGSPLWTETHPNVGLTGEGIYSLLLGSLTPFPVNAWSDPDRWLGTSVGGGDELEPRLRVASVPFAIEANRLNGKRSTDFDPVGAADIAAAGVRAQLNGNDGSVPNLGSNQVHWNNLFGIPEGIADGVDQVGEGVLDHGQLSGLGDNDHPQYLLGGAAATTDGNPPNLGSNRLHWDNLAGVPQPLVDRLISAEWLPAGVIDSTRLGDGQVLARHLTAGGIGRAQLAPGAVGSEQIADASINGDDIANSSVTGDDILNGTLTGSDIQDGTLSGTDILNGTLTGGDLAASTINATHLQDGSVTEAKLFDGAVSGNKLAPGSVGSAALASNAVGAAELQPGSVTGAAVAGQSLGDVVMANSPGLDFRSIPGFADSVVSTSGQTITSITLDVPGPGWIQASGNMQVFLLHDTGQASRVTLALSTVADDVPDSTSCLLGLPGSLLSELFSFPAQVQGVFPVNLAGPVTIYLTARKGTQPRQPSLHNVRLSAIYLPRRY